MTEDLEGARDRLRARTPHRSRGDVELAPVPRVALTREEVAAAIGISVDSFARHLQPDVRMVRLGKLRLVPVIELERWAEEQAESTLPG
jgi:hypothetical protein